MKLVTEKYDNFYNYFYNITGKDFFVIEKEWLESIN